MPTTTRPRFTPAVAADAGRYREWLAATYGYVFEFGGAPEIWRRAVRHARNIARMTGVCFEQVCTDIRSDYAMAE